MWAFLATMAVAGVAHGADFGLSLNSTHMLLLAFVLILGATWLTIAWSLPRLWPLRGRVVVRDAFGPSVFAVMNLTGQRAWRMTAGFPDVPLRRGLLVGLVVRRGWEYPRQPHSSEPGQRGAPRGVGGPHGARGTRTPR